MREFTDMYCQYLHHNLTETISDVVVIPTDILPFGLGDDEGATARLLGDPVVVDLPVELLSVLLPAVPEKERFSELYVW